MVGISSDTDLRQHAFAKGIREIAQSDWAEAVNVRREIRYWLGGNTPFRLHGIAVRGLSRAQYYARQSGEVAHTPAERERLARIFREHGITSPWGL